MGGCIGQRPSLALGSLRRTCGLPLGSCRMKVTFLPPIAKRRSHIYQKDPRPSSLSLRLSVGCDGGPWATYHARPGVRDTTLVGYPLVHGPLLVCKGSKEGPAHIIHAVHAHCGTLEDATAGEDVSGVKGPAEPSRPHPATSQPSPGSGEDSIEQWGPAVSGGQQEHILCRERT